MNITCKQTRERHEHVIAVAVKYGAHEIAANHSSDSTAHHHKAERHASAID